MLEEGSTMSNNYLLVYHGGSMPESPEEGAKVMQAWTEWFGSIGDALVDGGNPASATKTIGADGSVTDDAVRPVGLLDHQGRLTRRGGRARQGLPGPARRRLHPGRGDFPAM